MLLLIHIILAISGIVFATYSAFAPSKKRLAISYALTIATLISAGFVVLASHTSFGHACLSGLAYLGVVSVGIVIAQKRMALKEVE